MTFSTPKFWYQKRGLKAYVLRPLSWLYQLGHKINQHLLSKKISRASVPVICVGNAVAGGGGKTPTVLALYKLILSNAIAKSPYVVTRGYGTKNKEPTVVNLEKHLPKDVGDEPVLMAQHAPVIVSNNRAAAIDLAIQQGADLILLDDGFFNHTIHKDINILVVDRNMDFGNGFTLPAGPLREPLKNILPKTNAIVTIGPKFSSDLPVFESQLNTTNKPTTHDDYIGFCGIGFPEKFKATLLKEGYNLIGWYEFPDHHPYSDQNIKLMLDEAKKRNARLITTEKDFVKIPAKYKEMVDVLYIQIHFNDTDSLVTFLQESLKK